MTFRVVLGLGLLLFLAACTSGVDTDEPPEILYGQDMCDRCAMIIDDERYAAAYWTAGGETRRFDDIGGMISYYMETQEEVASFWVHDAGTLQWLQAGDAAFLLDPSLKTPMGFGIAAYADKATAEAMVGQEEGVMVMDFDAILSQLEAGTLVIDPMQKHRHDENDG